MADHSAIVIGRLNEASRLHGEPWASLLAPARDHIAEQQRRIDGLLAANTAEVERRRRAEQALRDQDHGGVYGDLDRLASLADPDLTGSTVQRVEQTIARLRAEVARLEAALDIDMFDQIERADG